MWHGWWLLLLAILALIIVIFGLIWLVIEFPGLVKWKEVPKESAEGRARQEKWRRDSVILGELQKRGRRVTNVDQLVTDLEEVLVVKSDPKVRRCSSTKMRRSATQVSMCNSSSGVSSGDSRQQSPRLEEVHLAKSPTRGPLREEVHLAKSTTKGPLLEEVHLARPSARDGGGSHRGGCHEYLNRHAEPDVDKKCENAQV